MIMNEPSIEVENFSFAFGNKRILNRVSLKVSAGDYLSIIGPNGAGKTTLIKCLNRILSGGQGSIKIKGKPLKLYSQKELAMAVSYVPQADGRQLPFTVEEFITMGRYPYLSPFSSVSRQDRGIVRRAMELTATDSFADRTLNSLSAGERQKVFIAAAVAQEAGILLLDEPTTFLDYKHQVEIRRLIKDLNRHHGTTIVAVTHDINDAVVSGSRVLALKAGELLFDGSARELIRQGLLENIYETSFFLIDHPRTGRPIIVPEETEP